jgi:hypothetical protein
MKKLKPNAVQPPQAFKRRRPNIVSDIFFGVKLFSDTYGVGLRQNFQRALLPLK